MKIQAVGLSTWLAIATAALVTAAVSAVSVVGVRLLQELAEAEALTRVELATTSALESVRQTTEDLWVAARVLTERPTLQRILGWKDQSMLPAYLVRYCGGAKLDGCAIVQDGTLLATSDAGLDWEPIIRSAGEQGERFLVSGAMAGIPLAGAQVPVPEWNEVSVFTLRKLDDAYAAQLSEETGVEISIVDYASFTPGAGAFSALDGQALGRGEIASGKLATPSGYATSLPLAASTGETTALLHALLPMSKVLRPVERISRKLLLLSIVVAILATITGIIIGRHWIGGVRRLTVSARRLGAGDLATSIPATGGKELGILGSTMEEMRRNLVNLTSELRQREAEAQAVLTGIVEGVYSVDAERRVQFINPQAERLLGTTAADAIGRFCGDLLQPARDAHGRRPCDHDCPILKARRHRSASAMEQVQPIEGRSMRVVISSSAPADGIQVQVLRDETALEAVRRTRDTVLANISHEFRTPLAAQLASIELLREGLGTMSQLEQRQLVFSLERGAQRLAWLIDNLLESVRIESGQLSIRRQAVSLDAVIQDALELIQPLLEQRGQQLNVDIPDELPEISGDHQRLVQVVVNLLANASKFGPPDSSIDIGAQASPAGGVVFWIDDQGAGPATSHDDSLFEQFRRSGGEDPQESGLGLGLFIVRSIVERHGGRASLFRKGETGARAQIELPASEAA